MSKFVLVLSSFLFIIGCATTKEQEASLDQKIKAEQPANTPEEIALRAAEVFASAPGLTMDQKTKLHALYLKTYADSREIRKEIGQMKSLLFKEAAMKKFNSKDITELTRRIVEADQRRLNVMFSAFQEMQKIVGYGENKKEIYEHLRNYDYPGNASR
ncbi:hypothetical protein [Bdellovibrio sp. NC01]|uniref:hypothetical protein n=1 Tax=Bdellovibrio sp. NC01 TaxID=2220073 RepID=UPI001159DF8E|nr:hypothetical protein [Bdellovibrio sp. NC01]QDK38613.1 hypothetical protein DOE51_14000 [Bdellovibrio sp. NC01]